LKIVDRAGFVWAALDWDGPRLRSLEVPGARVDGALVDDPLLGPAHVITSGDSTTTMTAIDWSRPTRIPTVAAPARLAPGSGGAIMNVIATLARDAGVPALRYAGRYPTAALFRTLLRSFYTTSTEDEFTSRFKLAGSPKEIAVDFVPAPFERLGNPHGYVELRDDPASGARRIERAVVDRVSYERDGSPARLVDVARDSSPDGAVRAELWFGDAPYAQVATFAADGALVDGPHPIPRCTSSVIGQRFPPPLVEALAELVVDAVPPPLRDDARRYLVGRALRWADLGARTAASGPDGLAVHAVLWERIAPLGYPRLAMALAEALGPVVTTALVAAIASDVALMSPGG
jgi:hypothetical protein